MPTVNSTIKTKISNGKTIPVKVSGQGSLNVNISAKTSTGTYDYNKLINHAYINDREVIGHKVGADYNLQDKMDALTVQEVQSILYNNPKRRRKE